MLIWNQMQIIGISMYVNRLLRHPRMRGADWSRRMKYSKEENTYRSEAPEPD